MIAYTLTKTTVESKQSRLWIKSMNPHSMPTLLKTLIHLRSLSCWSLKSSRLLWDMISSRRVSLWTLTGRNSYHCKIRTGLHNLTRQMVVIMATTPCSVALWTICSRLGTLVLVVDLIMAKMMWIRAMIRLHKVVLTSGHHLNLR